MKQIAFFVLFASCLVPFVHADTFGSGTNSFDIEFVTIGDPGNPGDFPVPFLSGSVAYTYGIGKYEIRLDMVTKANAVAGLGITTANRSIFFGADLPNRPALDVTWYEAARFVNWLNTSKGFAPAYKFLTQPGDAAYDPQEVVLPWSTADPGFDLANPLRNLHARYALPSYNERFKAGYYDPVTMVYYDYPTASDLPPTAIASGTGVGAAVFDQPFGQGPADVDQAGGLSPYGVMGLGGNAGEWLETTAGGTNTEGAAHRLISGGTWYTSALQLASFNSTVVSAPADGLLGFRVVSLPIPEPATGFFLTTSAVFGTLRRRTTFGLPAYI